MRRAGRIGEWRRGITRVLDAIQGHAPRAAAEGYGEVTIKTMAAAIERLPRIVIVCTDFSHNTPTYSLALPWSVLADRDGSVQDTTH